MITASLVTKLPTRLYRQFEDESCAMGRVVRGSGPGGRAVGSGSLYRKGHGGPGRKGRPLVHLLASGAAMTSHRLREAQEAEVSRGTEAPRSGLGGEEWPGRQRPRLQQVGLWKDMGVGRVQQFGGFCVKMSHHSSWDTQTRAETSLAEQCLPPEHRW